MDNVFDIEHLYIYVMFYIPIVYAIGTVIVSVYVKIMLWTENYQKQS
jgi:hypothetical protein